MTSPAFMDASARLREKLERRSGQARSEGLQRIPFILDPLVADRVESVAGQRAAAEDLLLRLRELEQERDPDDPEVDIRASGEDLSPLGQSIKAAEAEFERLHAELEAVTAEARAQVVQLVFKRVPAAEYERLLAKAGGAAVETDTVAGGAFTNSLCAAGFVRIEDEGEDAGIRSWSDFVVMCEPSFGELDPIRALVYANNRRGASTVPF